MLKRLRLKNYGTWFYERIVANHINQLDSDLWELYDENAKFVATFGSKGDMLYYIKEGVIL